eukprot:758477-Hanusia_phi.AAC.1
MGRPDVEVGLSGPCLARHLEPSDGPWELTVVSGVPYFLNRCGRFKRARIQRGMGRSERQGRTTSRSSPRFLHSHR